MPLLGTYELALAGLAVAAAQLGTTWRFRRRLEEGGRPVPSGYHPPVSVLIACKGGDEDLEGNLASILDQEYPGSFEVVIAVASEADPSHPRLKRLVEGRPNARLVVSGARPETCSEQNLNLLAAAAAAAPRTEVFVFADCDILAPRGWLKALAAPLADPAVGACAAAVLFIPAGPGFWSFLRWVFIGSGLPYFTSYGYANGASTAVRRRDFEASGARDLWRRSINMDLTLTRALTEMGRRVVFAPGALPLWRGRCDRRAFFATFNKWMLHFRLYAPLFWWMGALFTAGKLWLFGEALSRSFPLAALLAGLDMANVLWVFRLYRRHFPEHWSRLPEGHRSPAKAALAAPLLPLCYAAHFASSAIPGTLTWGGTRYRIRGPYDIEAAR